MQYPWLTMRTIRSISKRFLILLREGGYVMNSGLTLQQLETLVLEQAKVKGFGTKPEDIIVAEKIALIHSEISEAFEAYRHQNIDGKDGFEEELGDAVQRILHLCGVMGVDL